MQIYDSQDDMNKKAYRPAKGDRTVQAACVLLRDLRPLVHELGSISLETVHKMLYKLYAHSYEVPEGFTFGQDVLLLSIIIGEDRHRKTKPFIEMLKSLDVFEGTGAYYVVIDTRPDLPTLHAGAHLEDGLDTALTIAALVREQEPLEKELSREDWLEIEKNARLEYEYRAKRELAIESKKKLLDDAWKSGYTAMKERNDVHEGYIRHLSWLVNRYFFIERSLKPFSHIHYLDEQHKLWLTRASFVRSLMYKYERYIDRFEERESEGQT